MEDGCSWLDVMQRGGGVGAGVMGRPPMQACRRTVKRPSAWGCTAYVVR